MSDGGINLFPNSFNFYKKGISVDFSQLSNSDYRKSLKNAPGLDAKIFHIQPITTSGLETFLGLK